MTLAGSPLPARARAALALALLLLAAGGPAADAKKKATGKGADAPAATSPATGSPSSQSGTAGGGAGSKSSAGGSKSNGSKSNGNGNGNGGGKQPTAEPAPVTPPVAEPATNEPQEPAVTTPPAFSPEPTAPAAGSDRPRRNVSTRSEPAPRTNRPHRVARGVERAGAVLDGDAAPADAAGSAASDASESDSKGEDSLDTAAKAAAPEADDTGGLPVPGAVREIVEVVPESVELAFGALLALSLILGGAYLLTTLRARRLGKQRHELLQEIGLLQTALLPPVPERLGALRTSVAYRPAEGLGAGGDFYDALPLPRGRAAFILGDVSGHGRQALERTAFLRYTLRAYLEAGLEPRIALQVAGRVIDQRLDGDFATVVLALHDPGSASLTYACAGHPAPIVVGAESFEPVLAGNSPPVGIGLRTGLRQTTLPLPPGSVACFFTDGLTEARTEEGILGRPHLQDIIATLGRDATAAQLLERVAAEAKVVTDDMAACLISPTAGVTAGGFRVEQLEVSSTEASTNMPRRFLEGCGVTGETAARAEVQAAEVSRRFGGALLNVNYGTKDPSVEVLPRNVESIERTALQLSALPG